MQYKRECLSKLKTIARQFPAVVVTGARQTGKTTLLRETFKKHRYVSLDLPSAAELAEREPERFIALNPPPLLIDEVQYAPGLFRHLKIAIDSDRHSPGAFVLTGSEKFVLMKSVADSLAGRCALLELETLSLEEIAQHNPFPSTASALVAHLYRGGFPELWRDPSIEPSLFYRGYLSTYLERDVRQILNVTSLRDFERFIRACASRTAQLLDKASLARDVGVSAKTINEWLSVLEASNQIQLLEPYFENLGKRIVKSPKLYFSDTGLLCYLLGLDERAIEKSPYLGAIWETALFAQLRKRREHRSDLSTIWFYRDGQQREVDFVIAAGNSRRLVEVKWTENPTARDADGLEKVAEIMRANGKAPDVSTFIACRTPHESIVAQSTRVIDAKAMASLIQ
ncbi:MAG: ATP-binding protein [Deltaproteobacteria bacterium]|nr:ATP-binding protein [Deltaproteobacteria bacterium]